MRKRRSHRRPQRGYLNISGDNQTGVTGETLPNPFVVEVLDQRGDPMEDVTVTFTVTAGGGSLSTTTTITDISGRAKSTLTLGSEPGTNTVEVRAEDVSQTRLFSAEATLPPPVPTRLSIVSGDNQTGVTGETLPNPFVVEVLDQRGDPMEGATVTFTVSAGGGSLSATTGTTDANGRAESTLTLGADPGINTVEVSVEFGNGPGTNTVEVRAEGVSQTRLFSAEATLPPPVPTTLSTVSDDNQTGIIGETLADPFVVRVRDQYSKPLEGATVTFIVTAGGGSFETTTTTITDISGRAKSTLTLGAEPGIKHR